MSEVEGSIIARLGTGNEELIKALEALAAAAHKAMESVEQSFRSSVPEPVKAEQPERFEHRDIDGDRVLVYPHDYPEFQSVLMVETDGDSVRLSQDAVNGLAQYLDRYRTDTPCPEIVGIPEGEQCAGTQGHEGPCSPDADMIGYTLELFRPHWCGRTTDHPGHEYVLEDGTQSVRCLGVSRKTYGGAPGPAVDLNEFQAEQCGRTPVQPPDCCGHMKVDHGRYGCRIMPCECKHGVSA